MELIDVYDYASLVESWYKDTFKIEFNPYEERNLNYAQKFEMSMGFIFEGTTEDSDYIRLNITDKSKFFLGQIKYGFSTFSEENYCEE
jgi:hypothetical protein